MRPKRLEKFRKVAGARQKDLTVILENVWDSHNIGAVLRSCDSVGVREIFVLNTEPGLVQDKIVVGKRTSAGTSKWVDIHFYNDATACFKHVRSTYKTVLGTHLGEHSRDLHDLDLTASTALLFGNENSGITDAVLEMCDGNFIIPQVGMAMSLNISVACAVSLYEAYRQRKEKGFYGENKQLNEVEREALLDDYIDRHERKVKPKMIIRRKA